MRARFYSYMIFLIIANILTVSCQESRSLGFVIDGTYSMLPHMSKVKEIAVKIVDMFFENSHNVQNMLLVTFNEPYTYMAIQTADRDMLKAHINNITAHNLKGNWDCAEPSMQGILVALNNSLPGSYIYVFTDASSKDHWKSTEVISSCQMKGIQIAFVMTGHCNNREGPGFQVYHQIVAACSGFSYTGNQHTVGEVLDTVKGLIASKNNEQVNQIKT